VVAASDPALLGRPFDDPAVTDASTGFQRADGRVIVIGEVPTAHWRAVFVQDAGDFEQGLSERLHFAMVMIIVAGIVAAGLALVATAGRPARFAFTIPVAQRRPVSAAVPAPLG
jgi:hypothetical protein